MDRVDVPGAACCEITGLRGGHVSRRELKICHQKGQRQRRLLKMTQFGHVPCVANANPKSTVEHLIWCYLRLLQNERVSGGAMPGEESWKGQNTGGGDDSKYPVRATLAYLHGAANASPNVMAEQLNRCCQSLLRN